MTERFFLRELTEEDVSQRYLEWLSDADARRFIAAASSVTRLSELKEYVRARVNRPDVLFLGIFERTSQRHIGNIKFEPIDHESRSAVMGILIGEPDFRGKGVFGEIISPCAKWLMENRQTMHLVLGVDRENEAAISAYKKAGFCEAASTVSPAGNSLKMTLNLQVARSTLR